MKNQKLVIVDTQSEFCEELDKHFYKIENVEIINGKFEDLPQFDCLVSPANSFGLMDGGMESNY